MHYELRITHTVLRHNDIADKLPHEFPGGILPEASVSLHKDIKTSSNKDMPSIASAGISKRTNKIIHSDNKDWYMNLIAPTPFRGQTALAWSGGISRNSGEKGVQRG